ncbi:MAG TPA: uroporphyrinogen-III C-methyltransferase [Dokdonella sp.]
MSEDLDTLPSSPAADVPERAPPVRAPLAARPSRGGTGLLWLIALAALLAAAGALWRVYLVEHGQSAAQAAARTELVARLDELTRSGEQRKRELDSLRSRLADADGVNKSVREELLALGERSRHLEDAVANLAEQRQSGRDALAMNEAEFLLQLAQERLALFHDAAAAAAAYRLADSALAAAEDPVFASVRQTIDAELRALDASKPLETQATLAALERVRAQLPALATQHAVSADAAQPSRWQGFLAQFVHISHSSDLDAASTRDVELTRTLTAIDLRAAQAALLARDDAGYKAALVRARGGLAAGFDAQAAPVQAALAELDQLASQPLAPALPELGSALKELRNLRATRALSRPATQQPAPDAPASAPPPQSETGT